MSALILIVEDETKLAEVVRDYLHRDGFETHLCHQGDEVLPWLADHQPDARVKAVLRRTGLNNGNETETGTHLVLPESANEARFGDRKVELTALEARLLAELMRHPGRIFSRDQLMDAIYPDRRLVSDRTIDSHIKNLRRKLQLLAPEEEFVRSVYGAGYKYE